MRIVHHECALSGILRGLLTPRSRPMLWASHEREDRDSSGVGGDRDPRPRTANRPRALRSKGRSESDRNGPNRFRKPVLYPLSYRAEDGLYRAESCDRGWLPRARMLRTEGASEFGTHDRISMYA